MKDVCQTVWHLEEFKKTLFTISKVDRFEVEPEKNRDNLVWTLAKFCKSWKCRENRTNWKDVCVLANEMWSESIKNIACLP